MSCKTDLDRFFDGVCQVQPPVAEEQLAVIPPKRGVALLLAQGGRPIVLLPAADLRSRVRLRLQEPLSDQRTKTADLREGVNTVSITAVDLGGRVTIRNVTVNFTRQNTWPLPYHIDWSQVDDINDVAQVTDGYWMVDGDVARPVVWQSRTNN